MSYLLPIRRNAVPDDDGLTSYLRVLAGLVEEVMVVDGSPPAVYAHHHDLWRDYCTHIPPDDTLRSLNGKAWGVNTGLLHVSHDRVVVADDDVRYDAPSLSRLCAMLEAFDVVRPQNYFDPLPWHARWDTGRSLLNRVLGGDWPGTIGVRRACVADGYDGDVLFENLELWRTVRAAGGRSIVAFDLYVRRLPPRSGHFWSQRVRQAYDEFARPRRMAIQLLLLPLMATAVLTRRSWWLIGAAAVISGIAEVGRRRASGRRYFPPSTSLMAPAWVIERAVCAWGALGARFFRGGVVYSDSVLSRAAAAESDLRQRYAHRKCGCWGGQHRCTESLCSDFDI